MTRRAACWRPLFKNCAKVRVSGRGRKVHRSSDFVVFVVMQTHTHVVNELLSSYCVLGCCHLSGCNLVCEFKSHTKFAYADGDRGPCRSNFVPLCSVEVINL